MVSAVLSGMLNISDPGSALARQDLRCMLVCHLVGRKNSFLSKRSQTNIKILKLDIYFYKKMLIYVKVK